MVTLTLLFEYQCGEIVYLLADNDQLPRVVIAFFVLPSYTVLYQVQYGDRAPSTHNSFEITPQKSPIFTQ